jgi:hypothetical protein
MQGKKQPAIERFWDKISPEPNTGCWLWTGAIRSNGYGTIHLPARTLAHRFSYEQFIGTIPEGAMVCHKCDVRCCVNPAHLLVGTAYDNAIDCLVKGRNKATKLSEAQVKEIRESNQSIKELAAVHGVGETAIGHIRQGIAWRHV